MRISDDGEGMSRDDAILAFERHATSKIRTPKTLAAIGTLGFRGEALASIASVAKVELITKTEEDNVASRVVIEGGRLIDVKDAARDTRTTITVRDLFFNTPADANSCGPRRQRIIILRASSRITLSHIPRSRLR